MISTWPEGKEVITIESSPEPKLKRPKKPVRKVSVPLLAEINKIKRKRLRWYINHYNFGEVDEEGNKRLMSSRSRRRKMQNWPLRKSVLSRPSFSKGPTARSHLWKTSKILALSIFTSRTIVSRK